MGMIPQSRKRIKIENKDEENANREHLEDKRRRQNADHSGGRNAAQTIDHLNDNRSEPGNGGGHSKEGPAFGSSHGSRRDPQRKKKINFRKMARNFEKYVNSEDFAEAVRRKFINKLYPNSENRTDAVEYSYLRTEVPRHALEHAAERICKLINYILVSGPLTATDHDILKRSTVFLKAYYDGKIKIENGRIFREVEVFVPNPSTLVYKYVVEIYKRGEDEVSV